MAALGQPCQHIQANSATARVYWLYHEHWKGRLLIIGFDHRRMQRWSMLAPEKDSASLHSAYGYSLRGTPRCSHGDDCRVWSPRSGRPLNEIDGMDCAGIRYQATAR